MIKGGGLYLQRASAAMTSTILTKNKVQPCPSGTWISSSFPTVHLFWWGVGGGRSQRTDLTGGTSAFSLGAQRPG